MKLEPVKQTKIIISIFIIFLVFMTSTSLYYNLKRSRENHILHARESAMTLFQGIIAARKWNAISGIYAVTGGNIVPNPYLHIPGRDLETKQGLRLTMINPASMTRLISRELDAEHGISFHITSLKPVNPGNMPDEWEKQVLAGFETGAREDSTVTDRNGIQVFRYMAPLITDSTCLKCHSAQGYRPGEIRGGISVTIPFYRYDDVIFERRISIIATHMIFLFTGIVLTLVLGTRLNNSIRRQFEADGKIKALSGLLPICAKCKKIRNDQGFWEQVEHYIEEHSDAEFSHSLCQKCADEMYGHFEWYRDDEKGKS